MTNDCFLRPPLLSLLEVNELVNIMMLLHEHVLHYAALACAISHTVCSLAVIATAKTSVTYLCRDGYYILIETLKNTMAVLVAQSQDG